MLCAFGLSLLGLLLIGIPVCVLLRNAVEPSVSRLLPLAGLVIAVNTFFSIMQTVMRADQRAKLFVGSELFQVYGALALGVFLVVGLGLGVEGILLGSVVAMALAGLGMSGWLLRHGAKIRTGSISADTLKEFAAYGLPRGGVATIGTWILSLSDRYVIEFFRGATEVGLYSTGYGIADRTVKLVVASLELAIGPILINTWESADRATADAPSKLSRLSHYE